MSLFMIMSLFSWSYVQILLAICYCFTDHNFIALNLIFFIKFGSKFYFSKQECIFQKADMMELPLIQGVYCKKCNINNKMTNQTEIIIRQCHLKEHNDTSTKWYLNKHEQKIYPLSNSNYTQECVLCDFEACNTATVRKYTIFPLIVFVSGALWIGTC